MKIISGHKRSGRTRLAINRCLLDDNGLLVVSDEGHRQYVLRVMQVEHGMSEIEARMRVATFWEVFGGMRIGKHNLYVDDLDKALSMGGREAGTIVLATTHIDTMFDLDETVRERNDSTVGERQTSDEEVH